MRRTLAVILGAGLLVVVGAMFGPRAAHAIVATLVQVANTTSNPVPVNDVAPFQMFQASCQNTVPIRDNINTCAIVVPVGKRFVVQTVSVHANTDVGVRVIQGTITAFGNLVNPDAILWLGVPFTGTGPRSDISQATQEVRLYADGNGSTTLDCEVLYSADTLTNDLNCTVVGYLVNVP